MAGICGVLKFNSENELHGIAKDLYYLLYGCQNRGQASGKAITQMKNPDDNVFFYNNGVLYTALKNIQSSNLLYCERKKDGTIRETFDNKVILDLYGEAGIGGVGNFGIYKNEDLPYRYKMVAFAKDGWVQNMEEIKSFLLSHDVPFKNETTEVESLAKLFHFHYSSTSSGREAMKRCALGHLDAPKIKGMYSAVALTPNSIVAIGNGQPLGYLLLKEKVYFSSESAGPWSITSSITSDNFDQYWHDMWPGDIVEIFRTSNFETLDKWILENKTNPEGNQLILKESIPSDNKVCSFEWAYFARPDSVIYGEEAGYVRRKIGNLVAPKVKQNIREDGGDLDNCVVAPVLSSGNWYAVGLSERTGWMYLPGLYKNKYALKSFILDYQENREKEVMLKHIPSVKQLRGKEVILVDDSIVRGTTMKIIVDFVRDKGRPKKVHVVAGFPEKRYACPYIPQDKTKLIACDMTLDDIRKSIGADTLAYGEDSMWKAVLGDKFCYTCETGK